MTKLPLPRDVAKYFPYTSVRPFQDEFIKTIFEAVSDKQSVLIEGSNGLGKTISSLSACLPTAIKNDLKILYVARTHRQHDRVIEELKAVHKQQPVSGLSIRGRNEMCLNTFASRPAFDAKSLMEVCELLKAKGECPFYTNIDGRTSEYLQVQQEIISRPHKASEIQRMCKKKQICPYELVKASLPEVNVVALSYLYVFDPEIRTAFLKKFDSHLRNIILIVDEAHNLPETAIDTASSSLSLYVVKQAEVEAKKFGYMYIESFARLVREEVERATASINREARFSPDLIVEIMQKKGAIGMPKEFLEGVHEVGSTIKRQLLAEGKYPRSYVHGMSEFLLKWLATAGDESYINVASKYLSRESVETSKLEIVALDPAKVTEPVFSSTYANVIMSGTLQPLDAYRKITKLPERTTECVVPSPFPIEHVFSAVCLGVTTAMEKRTSEMYQTMIKRITEVVQNTPQNTGIFTASFEVLKALVNEGLEDSLDKKLFMERRGMSSKVNEKLVAEFKAYGDDGDGAVFLGVQGGRTSEGVDFPGNQMNSVIIVGVPYAEPTPRVKAQIDYYEKRFPKLGREYGYILPAMKKASQAAGRPIRTLEDRGAIVFLDYRFASSYCKGFLPLWITSQMKTIPCEANALAKEVQRFFRP